MKQVTVSQLKQLKASEITEQIPFEITADGNVIAVVGKESSLPAFKRQLQQPPKQKTQCPNCKFVYDVTLPDNKPPYFTVKHSGGY